jgi:hypothetical protein
MAGFEPASLFLNLYVYIISEISIKIKLFFYQNFLVESAETLLDRFHHARSPLFICWESLSHFPKRRCFCFQRRVNGA